MSRDAALDARTPADARVGAEAERSIVTPEHAPWEQYLVALVFVLSTLYLCLFRRFTTMEPDEGIILAGAERILKGQVLYRDFFSFFTPGSYYFLGALFKVFGRSFLVARTALAASGGLMCCLTYLLSRRACSREISLLVTGLVTAAALPYRFLVLHNWDSTLWACVGVYCAVRLLESLHWGWAFALGSSASLTFVFEQSKGAGLLLGLSLGFLIIAQTRGPSGVLSRGNGMAFFGGLVWPIAITLVYFASQHACSTMLADWIWPLQHYSRANRVPYGFQNWSDSDRQLIFGTGSLGMRLFKILIISPCFLVPALPLIGVALLAYWGTRLAYDPRAGLRSQFYVLVTAALSGLLVSVVITRADIIHFMYLLPVTAVVLAWLIDGRDIPGRLFKAMQPVLNAYVVIAFLGFSLALLMRASTAQHQTITRRGVVSTPVKDQVIDYVQAHVQRGEPMLVYPYLPLYNYLTETFGPTTYEYFQPGMNTAHQAEEMLTELESNPAPWVLFEISFPDKIPRSWPETPPSAISKDPVSDYILTHYRSCTVLRSPEQWRFLFMVPKQSGCLP